MRKICLFILAFIIAVVLVMLLASRTGELIITQSGEVSVSENEESFFNKYTEDEITDMLDSFFGNFAGIYLNDVKYGIDENKNKTADVYSEGEIIAKLTFDDVGYAKDSITGLTIDVEKGAFVNQLKDKKALFEDKYSLVLAYIPNEKEEKEVIAEYFTNESSYNVLDRYDLRSDANTDEFESKFVIIPNDGISISLYDCYIDEGGKLNTKNKLLDGIKNPILLYYINYESTTPQFILEFKNDSYTEQLPLVFSGMDGKIALSGLEEKVKDISVYQ